MVVKTYIYTIHNDTNTETLTSNCIHSTKKHKNLRIRRDNRTCEERRQTEEVVESEQEGANTLRKSRDSLKSIIQNKPHNTIPANQDEAWSTGLQCH